jgi:hypothetical protein
VAGKEEKQAGEERVEPGIINSEMSAKGPLKNFDIVFLEDLYKEIEENKNLFFIRLSKCYYKPLDGIFNELRGKKEKEFSDGVIIYLSSEKSGEVYLQYNFKREDGISEEVMFSDESETFSPIADSLYYILDFNRSIHFSSSKALVEKAEKKATEVLQKLGVERGPLFEKFGKGGIFSVEVEKNHKLSKYLWDKEEAKERIPSYFNRPGQRKMKKLEEAIRKAARIPIYLTERGPWGKTHTTIEEEMRETLTKMNTDSGALYLPLPLSFSAGKDSVFNTKKRIKTSSGVLIRKLSPIAITSETFYGYPNKSKNAQIVKMAFLHRYGVYRHEDREIGNIDVHLLEPILIVEYTGGEEMPFEVITSQKREGSNEKYKVFLIEKPKGLEENTEECKNKKKIKVKYKGKIDLSGRYDTDKRGALEVTPISVNIEVSGESNIYIDLEKGEAIEKESEYWLKVNEKNYNLSNHILNWALYGTEPSALPQTPPALLVILQVLRDVAKGYIPEEMGNEKIPEEYIESLRRRYYWIYHLFYDWSRKIIKSINTDSHKLPKELEGVKLLEKKVKEKLKRKEELLDRANTLCISYGEGEKFTININFDNPKRLQYSWGEKISLQGITPLNINLPIWYIIDGREYLLLFPKSDEEKIERMSEIKSINIAVDYREELKSKENKKVETNRELDIVSIEFEFCDGTRVSSRSRLAVLEEVDKIRNNIGIWYDPEEVTEKLKNLAKSLMEERTRGRGTGSTSGRGRLRHAPFA